MVRCLRRDLFPKLNLINSALSSRRWARIIREGSHRDSETKTHSRYRKSFIKKSTSSCVNATPLPVVLLYNARGGVGERFLGANAAALAAATLTLEELGAVFAGPRVTAPDSSSMSIPPISPSPVGDSPRAAFIT